jgi:drug/metabolite transporter (DMT)-like permease
MTLLSIPHVPATILARFTIWCAGSYGVIQGVGIMATDAQRWSGPAYTTLRALADPSMWGIAILIFGVAILIGSAMRIFWLKGIALFGVSIWSTLFSFGVINAMTHIPTVGTTAGPAYLYIACATAVLICVDEKRPIHDRT